MPPNPFQNGTYGILLATADISSWLGSLVFAFEVTQPPNIPVGIGLPAEQLNVLSVILLPV